MSEQDTQSDVEKAAQVAAEQAKALEEKKGSEEKEEPKITLTEAKAREEKAVQKAKIDAGRDNKALDLRSQALEKRDEAAALE